MAKRLTAQLEDLEKDYSEIKELQKDLDCSRLFRQLLLTNLEGD